MDLEDLACYIYICVFVLVIFFALCLIPIQIYDGLYIEPVAAQRANEYCMMQGFDFYDSYQRIGFFNKVPTAIKCRYVDQYKQIDFNNKNPFVEIN